jgi:hypothetical protein
MSNMGMSYKDQTTLRSTSASTKPHKFFEAFLDNDLDELAKELKIRYELIENAKLAGVTPVSPFEVWKESGSISTMKWRQYNVFQFHIDGIYKLYKGIGQLVREACEYYELDFEKEQFMIQGWFNINHAGQGKLGWHEHGGPGAPDFHGYYCVNAEPSSTYYMCFDEEKENINKNNRLVLSEMGHPHSQGEWDWEGDRITVAYDVTPFRYLQRGGHNAEQHWIPLA